MNFICSVNEVVAKHLHPETGKIAVGGNFSAFNSNWIASELNAEQIAERVGQSHGLCAWHLLNGQRNSKGTGVIKAGLIIVDIDNQADHKDSEGNKVQKQELTVEEALELDNEPSGDVNRSMYSFSQAYSALKQGDTARARETLAELLDLTETTTARFRFHDGKNIIGALAGILEGQLEWDAGNLEGAAEAFRRATRYYDSLNYDEPEPLPFSPRHWLGAAYIALGAYDSALVEYELDMDDHPNNVWSLHGAATALEYLGRDTTEVNKALQSAMEFADVWLLDSRL